MYDQSIWHDVKLAIDEKCNLCEEWFQSFFKMLGKISESDAQILYTDLCKVQIATDGDTLPHLHFLCDVIDVKNNESVKHFCMLIIDNGRIVDMLADCIDLKPAERVRKWNQNAASRKHEADLHRRNSDMQTRLSAFGVRTRREYEVIYEQVRKALQDRTTNASDLRDWEKIIFLTPERISRFDKQFWIGLQFSKCKPEEMKALSHKLKLCQPLSTCPHLIARHIDDLIRTLFVQDEPFVRPNVFCCGFMTFSTKRK
tara:strand:- start:309 stop:1079 length:771 start_codon:yes stop_codon:yes gene_type:complete